MAYSYTVHPLNLIVGLETKAQTILNILKALEMIMKGGSFQVAASSELVSYSIRRCNKSLGKQETIRINLSVFCIHTALQRALND